MFAITTCNADAYERYGRRMLQSFLAGWPEECTITVYVEGWEPDIADPRVTYIDLLSIDELVDFKARHTFNERAHGRLPNGVYDFRFDAVRFAHKTFAVINALWNTEQYLAFWVDADTVTHQKIPRTFLLNMLNSNVYTGYLARTMPTYPECGFVAYRPQHPANHAFLMAWRKLYADDSLFRLDEWHDSFVYEWLRTNYEAGGWIKSTDIAGGAGGHHPFINGPLGRYMDHFKGDRKVIGRTPPGEMIAGHLAPHWRSTV